MSGIEAYVDLIPQFGNFGSLVKKGVSTAAKKAEAGVTITPEMSKFAKEVSTGVKKTKTKVDVPVDADTTGFGKKITSESGKIGKTGGGVFKSSFLGAVAGLGAAEIFGKALDLGKDLLRGAFDEARESQKVGAQSAAVLKSTGDAANVSSKQIGDYASQLSLMSGVDDEAIQSGENMLLTFKNVRNEAGKGNDIFKQATDLALDMSKATGQDLVKSNLMLGKALNDPIKGITALTRVGVTFTDEQKNQIKTMEAAGNVAGAQKIILRELASEFGGSAAAQATAGEKLQTAWANFEENIGTALLPMLDKLETWFTKKGIPALQGLANYVIQNVIPAVSDLASWIGDKVLPPVETLFTFFSKHTGTLKAVGIGIAAIGTAVGTLELIGGVTSKYREFKDTVVGVKNQLQEIGGGKAANAIKGLVTSAGGLSAIGLAAGPAAVALGLGAAALVKWQQKQADIKQSTQGFESVLEDMTKKVDDNTAALNKNVRQQAIKQLNDAGAYRAASQLGVSYNDVTQAALGNVDAQRRVADATGKAIGKQEEGALSAAGYASANRDSSAAVVGNADAARKLNDTLGTTRTGLQKAVQAHNDYTKASHEAVGATDTNTGAQHSVFDAIKQVTDQVKEQTAALVKNRDKMLANANAALGLSGDEINYKQSIQDATKAAKDNGQTLDINTQKGRANRSALDNMASSSLQLIQDLIKQHASTQKLTSATEDARQKFIKAAMQMGDTRAEAKKLADQYGLIPKKIATNVSAPGAQNVWNQIDKLEKKINTVHGKTVEVRYNVATGSATRVGGGGTSHAEAKAGGGPITGAGTGTSDDVLIAASNGEYMQTAAAHKFYGTGAMDAIRSMRIPKEVLASYAYGKYAAGGPIKINQKFPAGAYALLSKALSDAEASAIHTVIINAKKAAAGPNINYRPSAGVAQWAPDILRVLAMLGQPASLLGAVEYRMNRESGGNPRAINNWDINAQRGDPSRGLMQTIGSTFAAYAGPFRGRSIYDPLANIYAGLNYALHAYGSISRAMYQPGGYAAGTAYARSGLHLVGENGPELVSLHGSERIDSAGKTKQILTSSSRPITIIFEAGDGIRQVVQGVIDENDEFHASMGRIRG